MPQLRLVLALHHHQPIGQVESVLEEAYETSYRPVLDGLEAYGEIRVALHTSGPLLEWLLERHPDYVDRLCALVARGQVEILGGGFFEPVMTMIPHRDRVGQIRAFTDTIQELFDTQVRGMWMPEGLWEQNVVISLAQAGIEYTVLDDFHGEGSPSQPEGRFGYYLTEAEGHLIKVFPACHSLPENRSFAEPHGIDDFLKRMARWRPGSTIVFAGDSGGGGASRRDNVHHIDIPVYLERFRDLIMANRDWLEVVTPADAVDGSLPQGKVYLGDRSSGWRNFQARHPESDEMYARMLGISQRLAAVEKNADSDPDYLEVARLELYRGQCGWAYWHGGAVGLGLGYLRTAVYRHLIAAEGALDLIEGKSGARVRGVVGDFNFDARQEVRLENDFVIAFVRPARGGHVYELDVREQLTNVLATLDRRPEADHGANLEPEDHNEARLYDRQPRKALVDHFYPVEATLEDLVGCRDIELGDFAVGTYRAKVQRESRRVALVMDRWGRAGDCSIVVRKTIALAAGEAMLTALYELERIPPGACLHFAVEINLAGMVGHARECDYSNPSGMKLGTGDSRLDLPHASGVSLTDRSIDLSISLQWSQAAGLWCFPIETVSQGEAGSETLHQSSAVVPHWHITPDEQGRWGVSIRWGFEHAASATARNAGAEHRAAFVHV